MVQEVVGDLNSVRDGFPLDSSFIWINDCLMQILQRTMIWLDADRESRDFVALLITVVGSVGTLIGLELVGKLMPEKVRRKLVHIFMGPVYLLFWNLFEGNGLKSRVICALVPGFLTFYFVLLGLGIAKNELLVKTLSRSGDPKEILKGPTIYGLVFVLSTILFWRSDPKAIVSLMILCGGDGLADVVGRTYGDNLRFSNSKSLVGSLGMFFGGFIFSFIYLRYFQVNDILSFSTLTNIPQLLLINLICTIIEAVSSEGSKKTKLLQIYGEDNITVSVAACILSMILLK